MDDVRKALLASNLINGYESCNITLPDAGTAMWLFSPKVVKVKSYLQIQLPKSMPSEHMKLPVYLFLSPSVSKHYCISFLPSLLDETFLTSLEGLLQELFHCKESTNWYTYKKGLFQHTKPECRDANVCISVIDIVIELLIDIEKARKYFPNSPLHYGTTFADAIALLVPSGCEHEQEGRVDNPHDDDDHNNEDDLTEIENDDKCNNILKEMGFP